MSQQNEKPHLSNITETAEALRVSTRTVNALILAKAIPSVRIGRRRLFNLPRVIEALELGSPGEAFLGL